MSTNGNDYRLTPAYDYINTHLHIYFRECLAGFVMQQTDFPFVAIVHDNAFINHSADIIREYAARFFTFTPLKYVVYH